VVEGRFDLLKFATTQAGHYRVQEHANMPWSFAIFYLEDMQMVQAIGVWVNDLPTFCAEQHLSNTAWAIAKLIFEDEPLIWPVAVTRAPIAIESARALANTAWSYAECVIWYNSAMHAIGRLFISGPGHLKAQCLANTAWAFATLGYAKIPLISTFAAE